MPASDSGMSRDRQNQRVSFMISSLEFRGLKRRRVLHLFDRFMLAGPAAVVQEVDWHALQARSRTGKPFLQCCLRSSYGYKKCRKNEVVHGHSRDPASENPSSDSGSARESLAG